MGVAQWVKLTQTSQSVKDNTSNYNYSLIINISGTYTNCSAKIRTWCTENDGTEMYLGESTVKLKSNTSNQAEWGGGDVRHLSTGEGSIKYRVESDITLDSTTVHLTTSKELVFTKIDRKTSPTFTSPANMGTSMTIGLPRVSDKLTHNLSYKFGNLEGTIATGATTSATWNVPLNLATQIPSKTSGTGYIITKTYEGSTLVGTDTKSIVLNVPASVVPSA